MGSLRASPWRHPGLQLLAAVLVGLALRWPGLGDGLNHDEAYTWEAFSSRSWSTVVSHYPVPNNHILHSLLVKASAAAFGQGEVSLRLPALLAGLLVIPATWWLAGAVAAPAGAAVSSSAALVAAWAVAVAPAMVSYSQVARGYTLVALFSALAGGALLWAHRQGSGRRQPWIVYGISLFLAVYTQPSALLLALGLGAWSLITALRREDSEVHGGVLVPVLVTHGAVLFALVLAYGHIFGQVLAAGPAWGVDLDEGSFLAFGGLVRDVVLLLGPVVVALGAVGLRGLRGSALGPLLPLLVAVSLLVPLLYGTAPQPRGYLFLLPWVAAAAALGAVSVPACRWRQAAVAGLLLSLGGPAILRAVSHTADPGWRDLGRRLAARTLRGEIVVAPFRLDVEVLHYAEAAIQQGVVTTLMDGTSQSLLFAATSAVDMGAYEMVEDVTGTPRFISFPAAAFDPVYVSGRRTVYRLLARGEEMMPADWQWNAHPGEVARVSFGAAPPAVSEQPGLAVRNLGGEAFRLFSRSRFRVPGPGLVVLAAARTDLRSQVSLYRAGDPAAGAEAEQVTELNMLLTSPRALQAVGRDGRLWFLEAFLLPVRGQEQFGVFLRGTGAPRQDFADIRVFFYPVE